ncbi:DUF3817 domain-containing protein [Corynebacterium kroppenstedtii]|uniref:DUF3817 domain-containing protein n=1 Tax=Corynebacterium sp. PCR 32 TaxID=3351342 RepID=UPI0030AF370B
MNNAQTNRKVTADSHGSTPSPQQDQPRINPARQARVAAALKRYSIAAYLTGIWLLILCVEIILAHLVLDNPPAWFTYIGMAHGFFFMIYLVMTLDLGTKARWEPIRWLTTCIAGTIPFISFVIEARRRHEVQQTFDLD